MEVNKNAEAVGIQTLDIKGRSQKVITSKASPCAYQVAKHELRSRKETAFPTYTESFTYPLCLVSATTGHKATSEMVGTN